MRFTMEPPNMLTVKEAASRLRVSKSLVYEWCKDRRLTHVRLGKNGRRGRILIRVEDLDRLMTEQQVERHPFLGAAE